MGLIEDAACGCGGLGVVDQSGAVLLYLTFWEWVDVLLRLNSTVHEVKEKDDAKKPCIRMNK